MIKSANRIELRTNGNDRRFSISNGGTLEIGSANTAIVTQARELQNLTSLGGAAGVRFQHNTWHYDTTNTARFYFANNDATYFGANAGWYFQHSNGASVVNLSSTGSGTFNGNVTAYGSASDIRLKENIERIANPIEKVKQLDGITFDYKKDGSRSTGLIAQQLLKVLPEVVYETEDLHTGDSHYAVRYGQVVGLLVEAIKNQQDQIELLKTTIEEMKNGNYQNN